MFPRVTHPSATPVLLRAFDLHVLGLPPAFVLSQDQTLKLNENPNPTGHFSDTVASQPQRPLSTSPKHSSRHLTTPERDAQDNVTVDCLVSSNISPKAHIRTQGQPAAHVSLSSDSIVKQHRRSSRHNTPDPKRPSQQARS